jgi:hypothetical protein
MFRICVIIAGLAFVALALLNAIRYVGAYLHARNSKGPMKLRVSQARWTWLWW